MSKINDNLSPYLAVMTGRAKGQSFSLEDGRMGIGRAEDNAIHIPSNAVSRHHAYIEMSDDGSFVVVDNGSKNGIQVNQEIVREKVLAHGDQILIGDSLLVYHDASNEPAITSESASLQLAEAEPAAPPAPARSGGLGIPSFGGANKIKVRIPSKRPLIYGGLGLFLVVMLMMGGEQEGSDTASDKGNSSPTTATNRIDPSEKPDARIPGSKPDVAALEDPLYSDAEHEVNRLDFGNARAIEAEQYFRRGRREYMNKKYHRAIRDFQTALSFDRGHKLSNLYLKFAVADAENEAQGHWASAINYFENLQYQRAIFHFNRVIDLMQHRPKEQVIDDAKKYIAVSQKRLRGAELFP